MTPSRDLVWTSLARDVARLVLHERDTAALLGQASRLLAGTGGELSVALCGLGRDGAPSAAAGAGPRGDALRDALPGLLAGQAPEADLLTVPLAHGRRPVGLLVAAGPGLADPEAREGLVGAAQDLGEGLGRASEVERSLVSLVEDTAGPVALFDRDMRYLAASRAWSTGYGVEGQRLVGRSHYEVFPDLPERWIAVHRRCLAGATERSDDDTFVCPDGRTERLRWVVQPWRRGDGEIGGLLISSYIVTEQRNAEAALRTWEARATSEGAMLRTLIDTIPDLVCLKDPDGRYLTVNRRCMEALGRPEADIVGRTDLDLFPPEVAEVYREHDRRAAASAGPTTQDEWVTFADGRRELVQSTKTAMRAPDGRFLGVVGIARDVTAVRQAHAELARAEGELRTLSLAVEHSPVMVKIGILKQADAALGVTSAPGRGTRFDLYFPAVETPVAAPDERKQAPARGKGETILLVEDEPSVLAFLRELLADGGYRVLAGGLPERALEMARSHPGRIDLVISDMVMPQLDGPAVVARLREQRPDLPALFLSGYPGQGHHVTETIIPKPVGTQTLLAAVRAKLDGEAKSGRPGAAAAR